MKAFGAVVGAFDQEGATHLAHPPADEFVVCVFPVPKRIRPQGERERRMFLEDDLFGEEDAPRYL